MAKTQSVSVQMRELLDEYREQVQEVADKEAIKVANDCVKELRATSPRRGGAYANSWSRKKVGKSQVVYNKEHYQLTHLLENGHVISNQFGEYGHTKPIKHIEPVEQRGINEYQERISRGLK